VLPPARAPLPSASGGFRALGGVWERWLPVRWCRLGPSVSRVRFPATPSRRRRWRQRIRSFRTRPRPGGAPLRRRRRARGGGAPCRGSLYRSRRPAEHRSGWMVRSPALCFKDKEAVLRCAVARRVSGPGRTTAAFVIDGGSGFKAVGTRGVAPADSVPAFAFISSMWVSVYCGSSKSLLAMEFLPSLGCWHGSA
jgi:hypothetical protein